MSTDLSNIVNNEETHVTNPSQSLKVSESSRVLAEIQAALTVAQARPRDEQKAIDRIMIACQRQGLAERAEYEFSKGGQSIHGASIDLMECISQYWGNTSYGFREIARGIDESTVECFAWDQENNVRRVTTIVVPHKIGLKGGKTKRLTDPRDIKDWIANQSQRAVRTCLENVIPRDIVEDALNQCRATLRENIKITPETIKNLLDAFKQIGVTKEQIEKRLQRNIESITPAQMANMRRIYTSIHIEGMSVASDWFEPLEGEKPKETAEPKRKTTKDKLKEQQNGDDKPDDSEKKAEQPDAATKSEYVPDGEWTIGFEAGLEECKLLKEVDELLVHFTTANTYESDDLSWINRTAAARKDAIRAAKKSEPSQQTLV